MDAWGVVAFGIVLLIVVMGGYTFMYFHIIRTDPREIEMRDKNNESHGLLPKKNDKSSD